ncbi:MAG TPA: replication initiation protein [Clostridia bacterium]
MFDKKNLVVQANKLIMAPQAFSIDEKKFILCLISKISPADKDFKSYRIKFDEYASFIGQDYNYVSQNLPKITKSIMRHILEIESGGVLRQRAIFIGADHTKGLGYVDVQFHPDLKDVLLDLAGRFTQYKLENALHMNHKHSIRLYEIIKANEFKEQKNFRLTWSDIPKELQSEFKEPEIQRLLGTDYKQFSDFEKRILKPAQKEIKDHTDLCFTYKKVKVSRFVVAVDFFISENVPIVEHDQMSLFDVMVSETFDDDRTPIEMARDAEKAIDNMDRGKLCREFQSAVKREYGFDFPLGLLEGVSNRRIVELLPNVGNLGIKRRSNENAVLKYITKALNGS